MHDKKFVPTYHLMDGAIEGIILCKNEENNKGHVDMMRISLFYMVKDLEDGQHLRKMRENERKGSADSTRLFISVVIFYCTLGVTLPKRKFAFQSFF